jgi:ankyrin repeat protein
VYLSPGKYTQSVADGKEALTRISSDEVAKHNLALALTALEQANGILLKAIVNGVCKAVEIALSEGADIESRATALMVAVTNGEEEIAKVCVDRGTDRDLQDADGNTAQLAMFDIVKYSGAIKRVFVI